MNITEEKLIFLISQPRAGSTLLQRILGNHSQIHTVAEPWIMLHPIYALRNQGYEAEYNSKWSRKALDIFLQELPQGTAEYYHSIRLMCNYLYERALKQTSKSFFLDKTPRYYYIIPELYSIFPNGKFIFLIRNPLDVLNSIIQTWVKDDWYILHKYRDDLLKAPALIVEGKRKLQHQAYFLKYEELISEPENITKTICKYIDIEFESNIINYNKGNLNNFQFGDPDKIYKSKMPDISNTGKWINNLENPQLWQIFKEYLDRIGEQTFNELGYSHQECYQILMENRPSKLSLYFTIPFSWTIKQQKDVKPLSYERLFRIIFYKHRRFKKLVAEKGYGKTFLHILKKIIRRDRIVN